MVDETKLTETPAAWQSRIRPSRRQTRSRRQLLAPRERLRCPFSPRSRLCRDREVRLGAAKGSVQGISIELKWETEPQFKSLQELGKISGVPRLGTPRRSTDRIEKAPAALSVLQRRLVHPARVRRGGDGAADVGQGAGSPRA